MKEKDVMQRISRQVARNKMQVLCKRSKTPGGKANAANRAPEARSRE